jgi:hypothetical protein
LAGALSASAAFSHPHTHRSYIFGQFHKRDAPLDEALNGIESPTVFGVNKSDGGTAAFGTGGTPNAVHIIFCIGWRIEIHHQIDAIHINPARQNIGAHQNPQFARFEVAHNILTLCLFEVGMERPCRHMAFP